MEKKYQLPEVEQLNELGFKFEFSTIHKAFNNFRKFVKNNKDELIAFFFDGLDDDEYEQRQRNFNCNSDSFVIGTMKVIEQIKLGQMEGEHNDWLVPPFRRFDKDVLIRAHQNRLKKYMIDTDLAFFDWSCLGISKEEASDLVLYNSCLNLIIKNLPENIFDFVNDNLEKKNNTLKKKTDELQKEIKSIQEEMEVVNDKFQEETERNEGKNRFRSGRKAQLLYKIYRLENDERILFFEQRFTVIEKAKKTLDIIQMKVVKPIPNCFSSITEKENVIRQYLKLQAPQVIASRNTRGKGINAKKKKLVLNYHSRHPDASISKIARQCKVDRKTVSKYLGN